MLKIIGIAGSPRRNGNSATLTEAILAGAVSAGAQAQGIVHLNDLTLVGCQGCDNCGVGVACHFSDELDDVFAGLIEADIWVLASPIYFDGVTGQMKTFFDRCRRLMLDRDRHSPQLAGPRAAAIVATYEDKPRDDYLQACKVLAAYLKWISAFDPIEILCEGKLGPTGAASAREDLLTKARQTGRQLVEQLARRGEVDQDKE